jgi:type I restriction enzyme R subunit
MLNEDLTEAQTRKQKIDVLLAKAGWNVKNRSEVIQEFEIEGTGASKDHIDETVPEYSASGFCDYLLLDRAGDPLAVVEAKRTSRDPVEGQKQAEDYADGIKKINRGNPFIFLTNGYDIWYWNRQRYAPMMIHGFFTREDLERIRHQNDFRHDLASIPIKSSIIDRDYQIEALKRVFDGLNKNRRKFLLVMATGTGKTRTVMALIDVLLRASWAQKVLFLADREALAEQAFHDGFKEFLPNESRCYIRSGQIESSSRLFVSTIQTMMECFPEVSPGFFDVIISDECHRSIYNKWRDVLSYFHAIQIGLTATPCDYIERDTFKFFDCEEKTPTFNYNYESAVKDGYLVDFKPPYAAQTNFQIQGIKGNELPQSIQKKIIAEGLSPDDIDFEGTDLEKKVTNAGTNESLVKEFMQVCIKDDTFVLPGKSIIFAISHKHAIRLWNIFNELYPEHKGRLVQVIDSKMERPLKLLDKYKKESFPRIAISVDMLDTGVDIREIVNLVFAKPVFSKIKFWQMIGRGTRTLEKNISKRKQWCTEKKRFLIIDHWGNFEHFGEKPDDEPPPMPEPLPIRLFKIRLEKLKILQNKKDSANFEKVKQEIINDIQTLPENSITVKENRRNIEKALSDQIWQDLDPKSFEFLEKNIASLMRCKSDLEINQIQFLYKTEKLALECLKAEQQKIQTTKDSIIDDIKKLPRNLGCVKEKQELINRILSDKFWENLDYNSCEYIKMHLTELMKHKLTEEREILKLDIDDLITSRKWIEFGPKGEGDYVANYREKVEKKILDFAQSHPVLVKIRNDIPISDKDLEDLEQSLNSPELYINEENLRRAFLQPYGTFIQFIKSILGKYKFPEPEELINESFNTYIVERNNKNPFSAEQIRFLRTVKNVFAKKKRIEYNDLFEPPFTQFGAEAGIRLFTKQELEEIVAVFNSIKIPETKYEVF